MSQMEKIRCLIVGDDGSGVSSLALSYLSSFPTAAQLSSPTINSGYERRAVMVDGQPSTLCLWWGGATGSAVNANIWTDDSFLPDPSIPHRTISTSSTDASSSSSSSMMADAALICVDIAISPSRVTGIAAMWLQRIRSRFPHCCVFLVGTKIDQRPLPPSAPTPLVSSSLSSGRGSGTLTLDRNSPDRVSTLASGSPSMGSSSLSRTLSRSASATGLAAAAIATPTPTTTTLPSSSSSSIADMAGVVTERRYLTRDEGYACATAASSSLSLTSTAISSGSSSSGSSSKAATMHDNNQTVLPLRYMECSALSRDGVQIVFDTVVQTVRHQRAILAMPPPQTKPSRSTCIIS